jgi:hypothetical protein
MKYTIIIFFEIICLLVSLFYLYKKESYWKNFIWFLLLTVAVEISGYFIYFIFHHSNHWMFNIYLLIETLFVSWILYKLCKDYFNCKPWILTGLIIFIIAYLYESIKSNFLEYSFNSNTIISTFIICICCMYYYYLLKNIEYVNLIKHAPFWIIAGIFFFYFGRIASNFFFDYLVSLNKDSIKPVRYIIFIVLNFILYSCWSYAFICKYKQIISS